MPGKFFLYPFRTGEEVVMKKKHPCGGSSWNIEKTGAEITLRCKVCGKRMSLTHAKLEKTCARVFLPDDRKESI